MRGSTSSEMQAFPAYALVTHFADDVQTDAMVMVPIKPCSVDGLRMSSTGEMDNFTFRAMGDAREDGCTGDMRASTLTVNGVIPSARKHKPVTLLSGDRRCDDMLEAVDILLLGKTSGWAGGDAGLFGA
jgi:hypothetical protein